MKIFNDDHNDLCVGIDLGTTNSALAVINTKPNGAIVSKVIDLPRAVDIYHTCSHNTKLSSVKKPLLPSFVYYREEKSSAPMVGDFAKGQYPLRPHLVAKSIKSQMGKHTAEGLSPYIADTTPAQISARILQHMLHQTERIFGTAIDDAIITVPANFDSIMCKATREAAALAGIKTTNPDGTERPLLLSEPNAVIYDMINQVHNGEISDKLINLEQPKNVLVFDLGGGTLDITLHNIRHRKNAPHILKVDEIATNRYTLLGGDNFDEAIAKKMYERYLKQYAAYPDIVRKLKLQERDIMPQLLTYAEMVKLELSAGGSNDFLSWDNGESFDVGGNINASGYAYDDTFTKQELEVILAPFMGYSYKFDDYKNLEGKTDTQNIIYPILDVLHKASQGLQQPVEVDYIIVNGGMSKFYLVLDRLTEFFGREPIRVLDPDQAVARGAAIYHHYLHQYKQLQDDMRLLGDIESLSSSSELPQEQKQRLEEIAQRRRQAEARAGIEWGRKILNDAIYLGVRYGGSLPLANAGAVLPQDIDPLQGFKIMPCTQVFSLPIKVCDIKGVYHNIASCRVQLPFVNKDGCFIALSGYISQDKTLTIHCTASIDAKGKYKLADFDATINVEEQGSVKGRNIHNKIMMPEGSVLMANQEISCLEQILSHKLMKYKEYRDYLEPRLRYMLDNLKSAKNQHEIIAQLMLKIKGKITFYQRHALLIVAYEFIPKMNQLHKAELSTLCRHLLLEEKKHIIQSALVSRNIAALKCLRAIGNANDAAIIADFAQKHEYKEYLK